MNLPIPNHPDLWIGQFPFPKADGHKYDRGRALICGGAIMTGAARLAARAAQRMGAGLVTLASPKSALKIYATSLESVIVREADSLKDWQQLLADSKDDAILIGPGLGQGDKRKDFVLAALETRKACVLDADALTAFVDQPETFFKRLHSDCVLTPHEGEFKKLFGKAIECEAGRAESAQKAAALTGCTILLKGHETLVAAQGKETVINRNAPAWLATAGAGDVLAGMILGLVTQKMPVFWAASAACWLHGAVANRFGLGLIAEDLIEGLPAALQDLPSP